MMRASIGDNSFAMGVGLIDDGGPRFDDQHETVFHFVQWHVSDYLAGTAGLTPEQEGIYVRFLMHLYSHGKPLPDDDAWMANLLRLSVRVWKRVKATLACLGKIVIRGTSLTNSRFEKERRKRAEEHQKRADAAHKRWAANRAKSPSLPKVSPKFAGSLLQTSPQLSEKPNKINGEKLKVDMLTNNQNPITKEREKERNSSRVSDKELSARLEEAAGACLKNPAATPGLLLMSEPRRWLDQGCDLELDILPALRAVAAKRPPGSVGGWAYFTNAVADAKATRTAPMAAGTASPATKGAASRAHIWRNVDVY